MRAGAGGDQKSISIGSGGVIWMMSERGLSTIVALPSGAKLLLHAAPHGVVIGVLRANVNVSELSITIKMYLL